jgi:hypothetical protein
LILVSGRTKEFLFSHSSSAADITEYVYSNWPAGNKTELNNENAILYYKECFEGLLLV